MRRRVPRRAPLGRIGAAVLAIALAIAAARYRQKYRDPSPDDLTEGTYEVDHVVDGDTIVLVGGAKVRLIGVNCPEMRPRDEGPPEPWAREATEFTRQTIGQQKVRLEFDRERTDKYGRFLAYVFVENTLVNEALLEAGLGRALLRFPYRQSMKTRFSNAENSARRAARGIWEPETESKDLGEDLGEAN